MKHFRCILLCLTLILSLSLLTGCSCGTPQDETSATTTQAPSSMEPTKPSTQETVETTPWETTGMADTLYEDPYETQDGITGTAGTEDGAGSMGTDEVYESTEHGGLMNDVTNGLDQIGEDITNAVDDVVNGNRARR